MDDKEETGSRAAADSGAGELELQKKTDSTAAARGVDVPERRLFEDRVEQATAQARRTGEQFALHCVHLDDFETIKKTFGESRAAALLAAVAKRMSLLVRRADSFTKIGESQFAILQRDATNTLGVITLVQRLLDQLSRPFWVGDREISTNVSVGISLSEPALDASGLLTQAQEALQKALADRGHAYRFYGTKVDREAHSVALLRDELFKALESHELCLHYQGQIDLRSDRFVAAEALARWLHPKRGLLAPQEFIPFAEGTRFIVPLGAQLLEQACQHRHAWSSKESEFPVAVNVSVVQFEDPAFAQRVLEILEKTGLRPDLLELELTETVLLKQPETLRGALEQLSERGVRFAIDDFGTGYSSLRYLRLLPLHKIKIAQEFIQGVPDNNDDAAIVSAVIGLGHQLGLQVVAEGVETAAQADFLRDLDCDAAQGFHFMRPEPPEIFAKRLQ